MATKDHYSSKKGRDSSFTLNNGTTTDYSTLAVKSQSQMTKKSNSFGGNEYPETKKDSQSWNESTEVDAFGGFGKFGKLDKSLSLKLKTDSGSSYDSWIEQKRGNSVPVSSSFGSNKSLTQLQSDNMMENGVVEKWNFDHTEYHHLDFYFTQDGLSGDIRSLTPKFQSVVLYSLSKLPLFEYYNILSTSNNIVKVISKIDPNGNDVVDVILKEGDVLVSAKLELMKKSMDLTAAQDPIGQLLTSKGVMQIWRASNDETYQQLIEFSKLSESRSRLSNESKSICVPPIQKSQQPQHKLLPAPSFHEMAETTKLIPKHTSVPSQKPEELPLIPFEASAGPSTTSMSNVHAESEASSAKPKKNFILRGLDRMKKIPAAISCKPRRRRRESR